MRRAGCPQHAAGACVAAACVACGHCLGCLRGALAQPPAGLPLQHQWGGLTQRCPAAVGAAAVVSWVAGPWPGRVCRCGCCCWGHLRRELGLQAVGWGWCPTVLCLRQACPQCCSHLQWCLRRRITTQSTTGLVLTSLARDCRRRALTLRRASVVISYPRETLQATPSSNAQHDTSSLPTTHPGRPLFGPSGVAAP